MKKNLLLFILFVQTSVSLAQVEILDNKNGFKHLKFGTSSAEFKIPESQLSNDHEMVLFNTNDQDLKNVFNTEMDQLFLSFKRKELTGIILVKNYSSYNGFDDSIATIEKIQEKFTSVLGKHQKAINDENGTGPVWEGDQVSLFLVLQVEDIKMQGDGRPLFVSNVKVMFFKNDKNMNFSLSDGF